MRLKSIKTASEIKLQGIKAEFVTVNNAKRILMLTDANGRKVNITRLNSYDESIDVQVPADPVTEEKFKVKGDIAGVPVDELHDTSRAAEERVRELQRASDQVQLVVEPINVVTPEELL
jgi:hypothetical protein